MAESRFYRHYKNKPYKFLGIARHSETLEELVLYETLYENENGRIWVRPKAMFFEKIEKNNQMIRRFEPIAFEIIELEVLSLDEMQVIQKLLLKVLGTVDSEKLNQRLIQFPKIHAVIAYDQNEPIAFKLGYALDAEVFFSWQGEVLPQYRDLGVGSMLMRRQHQWCQQKNLRKIQTKLANSNIQMIQFNLKSGFQIVGTEKMPSGQIKILFEKEIT